MKIKILMMKRESEVKMEASMKIKTMILYKRKVLIRVNIRTEPLLKKSVLKHLALPRQKVGVSSVVKN